MRSDEVVTVRTIYGWTRVIALRPITDAEARSIAAEHARFAATT
jgi:hypothetical protein